MGNAGIVIVAILIVGGLTFFYLLIRYLINRGVDKAADSIRNKRVRSENEAKGSVFNATPAPKASVGGKPASANGEVYLRDWYPDFKPVQIRRGRTLAANTKTPEALSAQMEKPKQEEPTETLFARTEPTLKTPAPTVQLPAFDTDICCICGEILGDSHAVLFRAKDGSEACVNRKCFGALRTLGTSEDPETVRIAENYIRRMRANVRQEELGAYLDQYLQSADAFLNDCADMKTDGGE